MLFENTARVPLIIYDPTNPVHRRSTEIVELIDIYPTAAVLAGFPEPEHLDGISIAPLMGNKLMGQATPTMTPEADTTRMDGVGEDEWEHTTAAAAAAAAAAVQKSLALKLARATLANRAAFTQYPRCHNVSTNVGTCLEVPNTKFQFMVSAVNKSCAVEGVLSAVNKSCVVEGVLNWLADYYVVTNCFVPPVPACCNLEGHLVCNFKQFM